MNNAPQFSLRWNNYVSHVTEAFNVLRFENDLVDVTLCCDGGKIKAHKMLLSACSTYFKQIFKENPCQHPVIIFRNFKFEDLNAIVNFMYHGEPLSKTLEKSTFHKQLRAIQSKKTELQKCNQKLLPQKKTQKKTPSSTEEMQVDIQSTSVEDLSEKNSSDSELAKFRCQLCPKGFKHPTSLTLHKDSHAGKTQCPVCHRSFSRSYDMRSHLQRIHQGKQLTIKEIRYKNTSDNLGPKQFTHNI
ncbi:unnamed protein product [Arctia plantaginis]|uniref:Uncharacterized protein n=1 Tax=Arctia plantaginis TaxID=874455 RepID=A0A8S1AXG2_ARCPL|nr:unnamed protein product [Arctia plantaginis]